MKKGRLKAGLGALVPTATILSTIEWIRGNMDAPPGDKQIVFAIIAGVAVVASVVAYWVLGKFADRNYLKAIGMARDAEEALEEAVNEAREMGERIMPPKM